MRSLSQLVYTISEGVGISTGQVVIGGILLLLVLLYCLRRNFWGTVKVLLIVIALGIMASFAYNLAIVALEKKENLIDKPVYPLDGKP
jgi:ABC-type cobalamin transport system permease subunit